MSITKNLLQLVTRTGAISALERTVGTGGIVAYHAVTPEPLLPAIHCGAPAFQAQMQFLAERYSVIPLSEFVKRRIAGHSVRGCVSITFDDAYTGVRDLALPILERLRLPATVFVASGYSATGARYWWDRLGWVALRAAAPVAQDLLRSVTGDPNASQHRILHAIISQSKGRLASDTRLALELAEQDIEPAPLLPLDPTGLEQLSRSELIDFGCHTVSHPALPYLTIGEQIREMSDCHDWLLARLPRVHPFVAFPYGLYSPNTLLALRSAKMQAGFSLAGRAATSRYNVLACSRIGLAGGNTIVSLRAQLCWAAIPITVLRHREWHPRMPTSGSKSTTSASEASQNPA